MRVSGDGDVDGHAATRGLHAVRHGDGAGEPQAVRAAPDTPPHPRHVPHTGQQRHQDPE